ncbi:hypothetical protein [Streptomyces sp. MK37H]|nr:hypothetical protein [Streptomyces sp. MK37H]MBP8531896.1 hypothetical protein [Streptomyces sp. MK37H]
MTVKLNDKAYDHAKRLIEKGQGVAAEGDSPERGAVRIPAAVDGGTPAHA